MNKNVTFGLIFWISVVIAVTIILSHSNARAESDKVVICHATASETNPYTQNSVDASSINNEKNKYLNGHGDHEGDIIPPFSYEETSFEGKNWDDRGKEIWSNECNIVEPSPTPTPTVTPTETPTASPTPTGSHTATPTESPSPTITPTVVPSPSDTPVVIVTPPVAVPEPTKIPEPTIIPTPSTVPEPTPTVVPVPSPTMTATPRPIPTVIDAGGGGMVEIPFLR